MEEQIKSLISKAAESKDGGEAMRFSQAAVNAAQALITLDSIKRPQKGD
jgi:hypothetical protein